MWKRIRALIVKETLAVWRVRRNRVALVAPPILQLMIFSFTGTLEVKNIDLAILNDDYGQISTELIQRFESSKNFRHIHFADSPSDFMRVSRHLFNCCWMAENPMLRRSSRVTSVRSSTNITVRP